MFDNDGTLWCEKPMPVQLDFILRRLAEMAEAEPELRERQPWNAAFDPEAMYWAPRHVHSLWDAKSIFITENGCAADDATAAHDGQVYDSDRLMFLRGCLGQLQRATSEGVPVDGHFYWSAQDNLEWNAGFGNRSGLIYVDFDTLERIPKLSAEWFREAARRHAVV